MVRGPAVAPMIRVTCVRWCHMSTFLRLPFFCVMARVVTLVSVVSLYNNNNNIIYIERRRPCRKILGRVVGKKVTQVTQGRMAKSAGYTAYNGGQIENHM